MVAINDNKDISINEINEINEEIRKKGLFILIASENIETQDILSFVCL
jgi:hypothetical protein